LEPILSLMNPVCILPPYFFSIHFNIILSSMPGTSKLFVPFRFCD
jgi:hypothetical protein